jgi:electron transfer flavoprotein alpha subunit
MNVEEKPEVWVVVDLKDGQVQEASLELLGEGWGISDRLGATLAAVVLGTGIGSVVPALGRQGAHVAYICDHPSLSDPTPDLSLPVLESALRERRPRIVLFPSDSRMRILAARLAARLSAGLASECTKLEIDGDGHLLVSRPVYQGRLSARVVCRSLPQVATFRAGYGRRSGEASQPEVVLLPPPLITTPRSVVEQEVRDPPGVMDLVSADVIVAGGRGVGGPDGFALLERLARRLGGGLAATRAAVDAGWVPAHRQVGLSGRTVAPRAYIACGISGATHHVVGMKDSQSVIAVNNDRSAPIFKMADVAILGDVTEVIPRVLEKLDGLCGEEGEAKGSFKSAERAGN